MISAGRILNLAIIDHNFDFYREKSESVKSIVIFSNNFEISDQLKLVQDKREEERTNVLLNWATCLCHIWRWGVKVIQRYT